MKEFGHGRKDWELAIENPEERVSGPQMRVFVERVSDLAAAAPVAPAFRDGLESATNYEIFGAPVGLRIQKVPGDGFGDGVNRMARLMVNATEVEKTGRFRFYRTDSANYMVGYAVDRRGRIDTGSYKRGFDRTEILHNASTGEYLPSLRDELRALANDPSRDEDYADAVRQMVEARAAAGDTLFSQQRFVEVMRLMDLVEAAKDMGDFTEFVEPPEEKPLSISAEQRRFFEERVRELIEIGHKEGRAAHYIDESRTVVLLDARRAEGVELTIEQMLPLPSADHLKLSIVNVFGTEPLGAYSTSSASVSSRAGGPLLDDADAEKHLRNSVKVYPGFKGAVDNYYEIKQWQAESDRPGAKAFLPEFFQYAMGTMYKLGPDTFHQAATDSLV